MKKLKDLKENECIKVNTLKEARWFVKKCKFDKITPKHLLGNFIVTANFKGYFCWTISTSIECNIELPASDFIKPKKSTKKIIKELKQEVARLDNEVCDIKKMLPDAVVNAEVEKEKSSFTKQIEPLKAGEWSITSNTKTEQEYIADYIKNRVGGLSTKGNIVIKRVGELGMLDEASDILKEVSKCINFHVSMPTDLKARIEKYCYFVEKNKKDE